MTRPQDWWRGAVVYQITPRSFKDSNDDGIGDLPGILAGLDHVARLGVDAVWITPFFRSPMQDFGYDVADYCDVDPLFGSLADFDAVLDRAHGLGLKVIIDMVWSHSSDQHPWFQESRRARDGAKADWYVWADPKPDGSPPNNWLSVFGGPAWRWEPRRRQYYLHHFLSCQPALNLHNPAVVDAVLQTGEFWLRRGVDGFRLDAVDFMVHDPGLASNPPRPSAEPPVNPFRLQDHRFDMSGTGTLAVMRRIRALMDRFPGTTTIAELSSEADAFQRAGLYTGAAGGQLHMAYSLKLMKTAFQPRALAAVIAEALAKLDDGWMCWSFSNHDVARAVSRWGDGSPAFARLLVALLGSLKGAVCLYQGEELGLTEVDLPQEALRDPYGINFWPDFKGRDGCRTPLPWQADKPHGGFTTAPQPWLPVPEEHLPLAVDRQEADPDSLLQAVRAFLAWRKTQPALLTGELAELKADDAVLSFVRRTKGQSLACAFNLTPDPARWQGRVIEGYGFMVEAVEGTVLPA